MKLRIWILTLLFSAVALQLKADAGQWLPSQIGEKLADMKKAGLKLSAEDIYSINKACIKDAVVGLSNSDLVFDPFCTGSFISDSGLVMTNYHPMIRYIEMLSNAKNDFLKYGYWAENRTQESRCYGLAVVQLVRMVDVTEELTAGTDTLSQARKTEIYNERGRKIVSRYTKGLGTKGNIASLTAGNQFILSIYKVYEDVRMVAAPPMVLGKFGGDADNWMWPRHTCDFALLRVYAGKNNAPAEYNKENQPLHGNPFLKISTSGVKENDFAMVVGYPSSTKQYIPSFAIRYLVDEELPSIIDIRAEKLKVLREAMAANPAIKLRYTARINSITNKYLRAIGELNGMKRMNLIAQKEAEEKELTEWINANPQRKAKYGNALPEMERIYKKLKVYNLATVYFEETALYGSEVIPFAGKFEKMVQMFSRKKVNKVAVAGEVKKLKPLTEQFFGSWDYEVDRLMYRNMIFRYFGKMPDELKPKDMIDELKIYGGDIEKYSQEVFKKSIITHKDSLMKFLERVDSSTIGKLTGDPVYKMALSFYRTNVARVINQKKAFQNEQADHYRIYMQAILEKNTGKKLSPDANQTQRISYGKVSGCVSADGMEYKYYTTLDGLFEKNVKFSGNEDYLIPRKIRELNAKKDFGTYAQEGTIRTCFMTTCHTSSGNSGSPVLNAKGNVIGLNFDRLADGVASDYRYLPELSRNICVDIRYMLFVLDKYSPSKYVLKEMKFVK